MFKALSQIDTLDIRVYYLEMGAPDSPWIVDGLEPYENVLPGWCLGKGRIRSHFNWKLPEIENSDLVILNLSVTDWTTQYLMRYKLRHKKWAFWAEISKPQKNGVKKFVSSILYSPLARANALVAIGERAEKSYKEFYPEKQAYNIPYLINAPKGVVKEPAGKVKFLFCGQIIARKAVDILFLAFAELIDLEVDVELQLVGREAELKEFKKLISDKACSKINYLGFKQPDDLPELFEQADVFILPSRRDGWGVVVNQAVSAGLPIIASDAVGAAFDLVKDGENGFIVPNGEVQPLAEKMKKLLLDSTLRKKFSEESLKLADEITPQRGAEKFSEIMCEICSK